MPKVVAIEPSHTAVELRRLAAQVKDANQSRRLLSIAAVLDGMSRAEAAKVGGMDRQTLRDWVHRFNSAIVAAGPDRAVDGVVRWRRIDLQRVVGERFGVDYHERSIGKLLKALGFSHITGAQEQGRGGCGQAAQPCAHRRWARRE